MMNKKGGMGFISMFMAIIVIVMILLGFVFLSGVWAKFSEKPVGAVSLGGEGSSFFDYMDDDYTALNKVKFAVAKGMGVGDAMEESGYEK